MPEVFIDGEAVVFEGALPETLGELRALLEQAVAGGGRVLAHLTVDGREFDERQGGVHLADTSRVEAGSLGLAEARAQVAAAAASAARGARETAEVLAGDVLRGPWPDLRVRCVSVAERLGALLQQAGALGDAAGEKDSVAAAAQALAGAFEGWADAVQAGDAGDVSLQIDGGILPALARLEAALRELEKGGGG